MSVTHIAGEQLTIDGRWTRQRCGWCGEILMEFDLARVAVPADQPGPPAMWPTGELVTRDGNASWVVDPAPASLPDDACGRNPLTFASFG